MLTQLDLRNIIRIEENRKEVNKMDLDIIITTLCSIVCTVVAVLTYRDSHKK